MDMYYIYIIKSKKDDSYYKGFTENLKQRLQDHNTGSGEYSSSKRPFELVWFCVFPNKTKALKFEKI
jgi:predicted GIY-YIG superfamily endonuclease